MPSPSASRPRRFCVPSFRIFCSRPRLRSAARPRSLTSRSQPFSSSAFSGRQTPPIARFSATLIEPSIAELLRKHDLSPEQIFAEEDASALALRLAARSMPIETKQKLAAAGNALDAELTTLVEWLQSQDKGLGQSADTAAGKMRYQMNRLRTLAANFQLQRETTLTRHADSIFNALYPGGVLQERVHGGSVLLRPLRPRAGRNPL